MQIFPEGGGGQAGGIVWKKFNKSEESIEQGNSKRRLPGG